MQGRKLLYGEKFYQAYRKVPYLYPWLFNIFIKDMFLFAKILFVLIPKKCHFMTLGSGNNLCDFSCDDIIIKNSLSVKILGLTIR